MLFQKNVQLDIRLVLALTSCLFPHYKCLCSMRPDFKSAERKST